MDAKHAAIVACTAAADAAHTDAGGVSDKPGAVAEECSARNSCRTTEVADISTVTSLCNSFESYAASLSPPACVSAFPPGPFAAILQCIQDFSDWASLHSNEYPQELGECERATTGRSTTHDTCNSDQGLFEAGFCSYSQFVADACEAQTTCRGTSISARDATAARVAVSVEARTHGFPHLGKVGAVLRDGAERVGGGNAVLARRLLRRDLSHLVIT